MSDNPYNRWQGLAVAQFSVAIALISGLSVAGLAAGLSLLQNEKFALDGWWKCAFVLSQLFFLVAAFLSCGAVITRVLDFRLGRTTAGLSPFSDATPTVMAAPHGGFSGRAASRCLPVRHF